MNPPSPHTRQAGFSLVEVTLALGIAGFCFLAIFGLLPVGLNSNRISVEQTEATNVMVAVVSDLQSTARSAMTSPRFQFVVPATGSTSVSPPQTLYFSQSGNALGVVGATPGAGATEPAFYRATVGFTVPSGGTGKGAAPMRIMVTWPAAAENSASWPTKFSSCVETTGSMNRGLPPL